MERKKTPKLAEDKLAVDYDEEDFLSSLPHLYSELKDQNHWAVYQFTRWSVKKIYLPLNT